MVILVLALLALVVVVSLPKVTSAEAATESRITQNDAQYNILSFDIDTGSYVPGTCMRIFNNQYPTLTLELTGSERSSGVSYQYAQRETILSEDDIGSVSWKTISPSEDWWAAELTIDDLIIGTDFRGIFSAYFYFRTVINLEGIDYFYLSPSYIDVLLDCSGGLTEYGIATISASYMDGGIDTPYNADSTEPKWIASAITFKVTSLDVTKDNTRFFYSIDGGTNKRPFGMQSATSQGVTEYFAIAILNESFAGEVEFYATDISLSGEALLGGRKYVRLDTVEPEFTVTATTIDHTDPALPSMPYESNKWANGDVTYTLARKPGNIGLSGLTFFVKDINNGNTWLPVTRQPNGSYIYVVTKTNRNLSFKSVNEAGNEYTPGSNYRTYISTIVPQINLVAVDSENTLIKSMGSESNINYRVGYASDSITFRVGNDNKEEPAGLDPVAPVAYEYAIREADEAGNVSTTPYYEIPQIMSNYQLNYTISSTTPQIKDRTYIFRIKSSAGFYDIEDFTVSVLKSDYSFTMDPLQINTNSDGWVVFPGNTEAEIAAAAERGVPVYLYVESFLGIPDEYEFYSEVSDNNATQKRITEVVKDDTYVGAGGIQRYIVYIRQTLNMASMSFHVINKAAARSSSTLTTQTLKLDAAKPVGNVVKKLDGILELFEGEWAATGVQIQITPSASLSGDSTVTSNISGVRCYPLMAGGTILGSEIAIKNGYFSQSESATGISSFRLVSGAGIYTDIHVEIKVDTSNFGQIIYGEETLPWIRVETLQGQPVGIVQLTGDRYKLAQKTAQALKIIFDTTHGSHITYEWAQMVDNVPPAASDFTKVANPDDTEQFFMFSLSTGATGTVTYVFNLYSKAKNKDGVFQTQSGIVLTIDYDNATFSISASTAQLPDKWTKDDIVFDIEIPETVSISKYQIRLGSESNDYWRDITVVDGSYTFSGIQRFITTSVSPEFGEEINRRSYGYSYKGEIWFRAISEAGKESQECYVGNFMIDKIDRLETSGEYIYGMHPLYGLYQQTGDYMVDDNLFRIYMYSNTSVRLEPAAMSSNNDVRELYEGKSVMEYYYTATDAASTIAPVRGSATLASSGVDLNTGWYWIIAYNSTFNSTISYKVYIAKENSIGGDPNILTAEFDTDDGVGAVDNTSPEGYFVFSWHYLATVYITVDSNSPVYYWYQIGATGQWQKFDPTSPAETNLEGAKEITFVGEETAKTGDYPNRTDVIKAGNLNETVIFRVTNLAGNVIYIDRSVVVRIEDSLPTFDVSLFTTELDGGDLNINPENQGELDKWYPNAIQIILTPTAVNPGGVTYKYQRYKLQDGLIVVEGDSENLPGNGKNFTTNDLSIFQNSEGYVNGTLPIYLIATALATNKQEGYPLTLNIDKTVPEFTLKGKVSIGGVERDITSGEWTNATSGVTIYRYVSDAVQESMDNASGVTYQYRRNGSVLQNWDNNSLTESSISSYEFIATTGAKRTYVQRFDVKIDTLPPVIISGSIEQNLDRIETYYIDQTINYVEENLRYAKYNEYPLTDGQIIATNTVDVANGGYVHIIIEDLAGNKAELKFYMTVFPLNVNTITLSEDDRKMLVNYENTFIKWKSGLQSSRQEYFEAYIARLWDRIANLEKMRDNYRSYLVTINSRVSFNLQDDYPEMHRYISYFISDDTSILYPQWLQDEIRAGYYDTYYLKLESEYARLRSHMVKVEAVQEDVTILPATNIVQRSDYQDILRVYNAYDSMSTDQKSVFKDTLFNKLLELKRKCEVLLLQDESTGISIDGKDLAAGVAIEVVKYEKTTELFNNAQLVLLETVGDDQAIVAISKLSLSGYGSQQNTGIVTINLPIPQEYIDYIYFSVYRLSSDGTLTPIQDTTISGDGKSVYFNDDRLDSYVLATRGNITVRPPSEKVYGKIGNIEINGTLLSYITYVAVGMFVVLLLIMVIMMLRRRGFFRRYNKAHKHSIWARGIDSIPKGNPRVPTRPNDPTTKLNMGQKFYDKD